MEKTNSSVYRVEFSRLRSLTKRQIKTAYNEYHRTIENNITSNPKLFWKFVNAKRSSSRIPGSMKMHDVTLEKPSDIVQAFADSFSDVFTRHTSVTSNHDNSDFNSCSFNIGYFTTPEVLRALNKLKATMVSGHDGLPSFLLHDCAPILCEPLCSIFNLAVRTSTFPTCWKISRITPVFKKGDKGDIYNYRPISILPNCAKVFEQLLYERLYHSVKPYLSIYQHGFIRGRSTASNLVELTQYVSESLDKRLQVDIIYTDFSKAFDTIDHCILISKLCAIGFCPSALALIQSYLNDRSCYVYYNGFSSSTFTPSSGVPQGSNLGPLLFNIYINDLLLSLDCNVLAYADDLKIYNAIRTQSDAHCLQKNITTISEWCLKNKVSLNIEKCAVLSFTRSPSPQLFDYNVANTSIPRVNLFKDLGVLFDPQLSFAPHIEAMTSSASKSLGFLFRTCRNFSNINALQSVYYSLVRSKLEYGSTVWYPCYHYLELSIERLQKRFLKYLSYKSDGIYPPQGTDYTNLLLRHGFDSLAQRRNVASGRFVIKLVNDQIDSPSLLSQVSFVIPQYNYRSPDTFYLPTARTNILLKAPLYHMCKNANNTYVDPFLIS